MGYGKLNEDGTLISSTLQHDGMINLNLFAKDENGNFFSYYLPNMIYGMYQPDVDKITAEAEKTTIAHFKGLYLGVVNEKLAELDYDSLATVKLWEGDATFGAEATAILDWYKSIITYNYDLLNAGTVPTDEEYIAAIPAYVGV